jgi:hypothetical protein
LNLNVINTSRIEGDLRHVFETCHNHPDMTIVAAFRNTLAEWPLEMSCRAEPLGIGARHVSSTCCARALREQSKPSA